MSIITYQDYERATDKTAWLQDALVSYRNSDEFKKALDEQEYMAGRNTAITQTSDPCENCSSNPKNGGSGNCNCTLGSKNITTC